MQLSSFFGFSSLFSNVIPNLPGPGKPSEKAAQLSQLILFSRCSESIKNLQ
jgi:hypothetical protein